MDDDTDGDDENHGNEPSCCRWRSCCGEDGSCPCGCSCCGKGDTEGGGSGPDPEPPPDDVCDQHGVPYEQCAPLHEQDYTNAAQRVSRLSDVLYIRKPPVYRSIHLDVPTDYHRCCPCPSHSTNYVGVAYQSWRLRLLDDAGLNFEQTERTCEVLLAGVHPSSAAGDATLAFTRNGEIYEHRAYTVLGVAIGGPDGGDLTPCNALNGAFGYPVGICTNVEEATRMSLVTDVGFTEGNIHLELADATGQFAVW